MKQYLPPGRQLAELPIFRLLAGAPLFIALVCVIGIWASNLDSMCLDFRLSCINNFFGTYKVPIAFSSLSIALGTVVATLHRSAQTDFALKESQRKNDFDRRFKHEEEFKNHRESLNKVIRSTFDDQSKEELKEQNEKERPGISVLFTDNFFHYSTYFPNNKTAASELVVSRERRSILHLHLRLAEAFDAYFNNLSILLEKNELSHKHFYSEQKRCGRNLASTLYVLLGIDILIEGKKTPIGDPLADELCDLDNVVALLSEASASIEHACSFMGQLYLDDKWKQKLELRSLHVAGQRGRLKKLISSHSWN